MITNLHTHTTFSDGKNTPEEIVLTALEQGFCSIGFSDHAYTSYDISYCMNDEKGYIKEVRRLQEKYKKEIEIYLYPVKYAVILKRKLIRPHWQQVSTISAEKNVINDMYWIILNYIA